MVVKKLQTLAEDLLELLHTKGRELDDCQREVEVLKHLLAVSANRGTSLKMPTYDPEAHEGPAVNHHMNYCKGGRDCSFRALNKAGLE